MHHLGSGIWSQMRWRTGIIFITTRPATSIRSHCRGLKRMASEPNRAMSYRLAAVAISSIPQQAVANGIGHRLLARAWLATQSSWVTMKSGNFTLRSRRSHRSFGLTPPEDPFPPGVHVADAQRDEEHDHLPEHDPPERLA